MKNTFTSSLLIKSLAFLLSAILFTSLCFFALCYGILTMDSGYRETGSYDGSQMAVAVAKDFLDQAYWLSNRDRQGEEDTMALLRQRAANSNIRYDCHSTLTNNNYSFREKGDILLFSQENAGKQWSVYRTKELTKYDAFYYTSQFYTHAERISHLGWLVLIFFSGEMLLGVFLAYSAGRRKGVEGFVLGWQEKLPFDVVFALLGGMGLWLVWFFGDNFSTLLFQTPLPIFYLVSGICFFLFALILFAVWMHMCLRIKTHTLWQSCIIIKLLKLALRILRRMASMGKKSFHALFQGGKTLIQLLPLLWRTVLCTLVYLLCLLIAHGGEAHLLFVLLCLGLLAGVIYFSVMLIRLKKNIHQLSQGEQNIVTNTHYMLPAMRETAEELATIRNGITLAVEAQLTSERMKTELITNVSHDIKTPLTSLVSYVDLLRSEKDEQKREEYLEVLGRQSQKLKKLTEDLVELSKSGSGAMVCTPLRRSLAELVRQALGEYTDKLQNEGLNCCLQMPEKELYCLADGNLTWRVLDNLLGNACKYAQSGTRLYVSAYEDNAMVYLELKNISREPLNISADELMERFKRGDASRNSEGSGLGLNIAENLAKLQGGSLEISIDGDLFKAVYSLRKCP